MMRNVGTTDKVLRIVGAALAGACALTAPFSLGIRLGVLLPIGVYLLLTALAGTCLGYRLMGKSTCGIAPHT